MIINMVKDLKSGLMEQNMKGNTKMAKKRAMGNCTLQTVLFMRVIIMIYSNRVIP